MDVFIFKSLKVKSKLLFVFASLERWFAVYIRFFARCVFVNHFFFARSDRRGLSQLVQAMFGLARGCGQVHHGLNDVNANALRGVHGLWHQPRLKQPSLRHMPHMRQPSLDKLSVRVVVLGLLDRVINASGIDASGA